MDRIDLKKQLHSLAFAQAGYFSARQALDVGYSYQAQKYHVDRGNWQKIDRALFRLPGWPAQTADIYVRWSVWSDNAGVISHQSAADVHGLGDFDAGDVHLTLPHQTKSKASGVILHTSPLAASEIQSKSGFKVTALLRTVLDLAASSLDQDRLTAVVRDGLDSTMLTRRKLRNSVDEFGPMAGLKIERALAALEAQDGEQ